MQIQGKNLVQGSPFLPTASLQKHSLCEGFLSSQTLRAPSDLQEAQQGGTSSTSSAVLTPKCSHSPSREKKLLPFGPMAAGEAPPSYPWGSSAPCSSVQLSPGMAPCWQPEAPKQEGLPVVVQRLQEKRFVNLPSRCLPSRRFPHPNTPLSPTTPHYYSLCFTCLRVSRVTTPYNPFCCEHEICLRAGASSEMRHPFLPGLAWECSCRTVEELTAVSNWLSSLDVAQCHLTSPVTIMGRRMRSFWTALHLRCGWSWCKRLVLVLRVLRSARGTTGSVGHSRVHEVTAESMGHRGVHGTQQHLWGTVGRIGPA